MSTSRLSPLDTSFLHVETPSAHMHVGFKGRFAPPPGGSAPALPALRAQVAARLRHVPRLRQRLAFPPAGIGRPVWVDDDRFAVEDHVTLLGGDDEPLSRARFDELADVALSTPLDRSRPLWQIQLAPRLTDGSAGLVMKAHHAMVDGISAVALTLLVLDVDPDAAPPVAGPDDEWRPRPAPGAARLALGALGAGGGESLRAARGIARAATSPSHGARIAGTLRRAALAVGEDVLRPAPSSYVNRPIGPQRTLVHHTAPLEPLLAARRRLDAPLNDLVLTAVAGALRTMAVGAGARPAPMKAMVPVSRRDPGQAHQPGNRISFVFVELPVDVSRAADRLARIRTETARFKRDGRAAGGEALLGALGLLPPALQRRAALAAAAPRTYNLTISNVPGPRMPTYLLGAELLEAAPVIPLSDGHALAVGVLTHADRITFAFHADPVALPDARSLPGALAAALLEVEGLSLRTLRAGPRRRGAHRVAQKTGVSV